MLKIWVISVHSWSRECINELWRTTKTSVIVQKCHTVQSSRSNCWLVGETHGFLKATGMIALQSIHSLLSHSSVKAGKDWTSDCQLKRCNNLSKHYESHDHGYGCDGGRGASKTFDYRSEEEELLCSEESRETPLAILWRATSGKELKESKGKRVLTRAQTNGCKSLCWIREGTERGKSPFVPSFHCRLHVKTNFQGLAIFRQSLSSAWPFSILSRLSAENHFSDTRMP